MDQTKENKSYIDPEQQSSDSTINDSDMEKILNNNNDDHINSGLALEKKMPYWRAVLVVLTEDFTPL